MRWTSYESEGMELLFEEAIDKFAEYLELIQRSKKTVCTYTKLLKDFNSYLCNEHNRPVYLEEVRACDMDKYLFNVLTEIKYSSSHRHNMVTAFRSLYNFCSMRGYCSSNVAKQVKYIKVYTKERTYISELELMRIAKHIQSNTVKTALWTIFYTGLRISEVTNLKIVDIDFEHEQLFVREGKGKKERIIPINGKLKKLLISYLQNDREDALTDYFLSCRTGKISPVRIQEVLRDAVNKASINKQVTPHVLRHSFASNLLERGVDIFRVQKLLGHEAIKTTEIYLHTSMEELEKVVNIL